MWYSYKDEFTIRSSNMCKWEVMDSVERVLSYIIILCENGRFVMIN